MVCVDISMQGKTDLYIIQNTALTAAWYISEILDVYIRSYAFAIGLDFILMNDFSYPHSARVTNKYLRQQI
jgi:hypothetical protein